MVRRVLGQDASAAGAQRSVHVEARGAGSRILPIDRIIRESSELAAHGIGSIAVMPNDPAEYPEDSFDNMKRVAAQKRFSFPYVIDETQDAARAYGAVCTPEFLGFDAALELQYHGRLDGLFEAMVQIANTGIGPKEQIASIGCSIKWKK